MIPKCCQHCLKPLKAQEREVCSEGTCVAWRRAQVLNPESHKEAVLKQLAWRWAEHLKLKGSVSGALGDRYSALYKRVKEHGWEDASGFLSEIEALFASPKPAFSKCQVCGAELPVGVLPPGGIHLDCPGPSQQPTPITGHAGVKLYDYRSEYPRDMEPCKDHVSNSIGVDSIEGTAERILENKKQLGLVEQMMRHHEQAMQKMLEASEKMMQMQQRQLDRLVGLQTPPATTILKSPCGNPVDSKQFGVGDVVDHKDGSGGHCRGRIISINGSFASVEWPNGIISRFCLQVDLKRSDG